MPNENPNTCFDYSKPKGQNKQNGQISNFQRTDSVNSTVTKEENERVLTPIEIKKHLDETVVGQDRAKRILATEVYKHYLKITKSKWLHKNKKKLSKSNILLTGLSGTGKTYLAEQVAKVLGVPFTIIDCANLTPSGFRGGDIEDMFSKLLNSDGDGDLERGIVVLDELDKIRTRGAENETRNGMVEGVQQGLLKIIEGTIIKSQTMRTEIDTTDILFIGAGAFEGIDTVVSERLNKGINKKVIGFNSTSSSDKKEYSSKELRGMITRDDLYKFGFLPELLGRFPIISNLLPLEKADLIEILKLDNGIFSEYKTLFELQGKNLVIDEGVYEAIAEISIKENVGARGLKSIIESSFGDLMFNAPSEDIKEYYIDRNFIDSNYKNENTYLNEACC